MRAGPSDGDHATARGRAPAGPPIAPGHISIPRPIPVILSFFGTYFSPRPRRPPASAAYTHRSRARSRQTKPIAPPLPTPAVHSRPSISLALAPVGVAPPRPPAHISALRLQGGHHASSGSHSHQALDSFESESATRCLLNLRSLPPALVFLPPPRPLPRLSPPFPAAVSPSAPSPSFISSHTVIAFDFHSLLPATAARASDSGPIACHRSSQQPTVHHRFVATSVPLIAPFFSPSRSDYSPASSSPDQPLTTPSLIGLFPVQAHPSNFILPSFPSSLSFRFPYFFFLVPHVLHPPRQISL